jgi:predicted nucleotide-binding protein (sugar kinase/HSP70/actin superfamily)
MILINKITIGIPKAFLYYKYKYLWEVFFRTLGFQVVTSDDSNKQILKDGIDCSIDEACLSSKMYMGHVYSLIGKVDYILIPRIASFGKNEVVCTKFNAMYDIVKNTFNNIKILDYDVDVLKKKYQRQSFLKMGLRLKKNIFDIMRAYKKALRVQAYMERMASEKQDEIVKQDNVIKILLLAHPYNTYDKLIGYPIIEYLKKLEVIPIFADLAPKKEAVANSLKISESLYWTYSKELIGAIDYYKNNIDGIIYLSTFPCGPDSLVNELCMRKVKDIPCCNIVLDELQGEAGLHTRIESFVDIIKQKNNFLEEVTYE